MLLLCTSPVCATASVGLPADCSRLTSSSPSGVYVIQPAQSPPRVVWCDMDTEGKGWTVVQRNTYSTEITWKESWTTYKYGFGNVQGDHWLGTEYLHLLTQQGTYKVRFVVRDKANVTHYAEYDIFRVESESSGYPLRLGRLLSSGKDYLTSYYSSYGGIHDNMKFSTVDKDQDQHSGNCASSYGGWWYDRCQNVLLNGKKYIGGEKRNKKFVQNNYSKKDISYKAFITRSEVPPSPMSTVPAAGHVQREREREKESETETAFITTSVEETKQSRKKKKKNIQGYVRDKITFVQK